MLRSCERYDPASNTFSRVAELLNCQNCQRRGDHATMRWRAGLP